jgi:NAD(P)-dependent dehydrogenase (short-subunit alcohol dehydrogenase family)
MARQLGQLGVDVAINYRSKRPKAQAVADELNAMGRKPLLIEADITKAEDIATIVDQIEAAWRRLDLLILNASGGLEQDKAADYAMQPSGPLPRNRARKPRVAKTSNIARKMARSMPADRCRYMTHPC